MVRLAQTLLMMFASTVVFLQGCGKGATCATYACPDGYIKDSTKDTVVCNDGSCTNLQCCKSSCSGRPNLNIQSADPTKDLLASTTTAVACQRKCAKDEHCKFWKWYDTTAAVAEDQMRCHLFKMKVTEAHLRGVTSGGPCEDVSDLDHDDVEERPRNTSVHPHLLYKPLCNDTLVRDDSVAFTKDLPINSKDDCMSLAEEVKIRFNMRGASQNASAWAGRRCYMHDNEFHFGYTNHTASRLACQKVVQTKCETRNEQCSGQVKEAEIGQNNTMDLYWTPFRRYKKTSDRDLTQEKIFMRRTCKTEACDDLVDKVWCCDVKRGTRAKEQHKITDDDFETLSKGYRFTKSNLAPEAILLNKKNDTYLNSYSYRTIETCKSSQMTLETSSFSHETSENSSQSESSFSHHEAVSVSSWIFSFFVSHKSTEVRSADAQTFIDKSSSDNLVVDQNKTDCESKELSNLFSSRPLFSNAFLGRLSTIQSAMESGKTEPEQRALFYEIIDSCGTHVITKAMFGASTRILHRSTGTQKTRNTETSSQNCEEGNRKIDASIKIDAPAVSGDANVGTHSTHKDCSNKNNNTSSSSSEKMTNTDIEVVGSCTCADGRNTAAQSNLLISVQSDPFVKLLRHEWLTPSAWFSIYDHYDVRIIREFFDRWFGLEFEKTTCFIRDSNQFTEDHHQRARSKFYEDPESCQLQMCANRGRETNTTRIHQVCIDDKCDDWCCIPAPNRRI